MTTQLYLISPPVIEDINRFAKELEAALAVEKGLVGAFQLRLKDETALKEGRTTYDAPADEWVMAVSKKLKPLCHKHEVAFVINDSPQLAVDCGADGVHLGQEDGAIKAARAIVGAEMVIGATCHNSRHLAMTAGEDGADYVAFGAFYPTRSKTPEALKKWDTPTTNILQWWQEMMELPCVAIGGITAENCKPLIDAGADFIAVITAVWNHPQGAAAGVEAFRKHLI